MKISVHGVYKFAFYCLTLGVIAILARDVFLMAIYSLDRINYGDSAFLYYLSWLQDKHDVIPFRDFLETSFPGTYWFYSFVVNVFGYSDIGYRIVDLLSLLIFSAMSFFLVRKVSPLVALMSVLYFSEYYLDNSGFGLQRDYIALFPLMLSLLLAGSMVFNVRTRLVIAGFFLALSFSIKPHIIIGAPVILWYFSDERFCESRCVNNMLYKILWSGFGFLSGVFLCVIFLLKAGSFPGFLEVAKNYLPLYLNLIDVGPGRVIMASWNAPGINDIFNIIFSPGFETIPLIISCFFVFILRDLEKIKMAFLVFLLVISYRIYAYIGMKDFDYYYIPARYFVFVGVSMAAVLLPLNANRLLKSAHILWLCVIFYSVFNSGIASGYRGDISNAARVNAKNDLEAYLNKNIRPGDGVQPKVQGTHGPIFPAMLSAELPMAISRFPLSQAFYHHVHDPYVSSLQVEYMRYLKKNPPRFILDDNGFAVYEELSNERPFPEYEDFLEANYRKVYDNLDRASAPDQFIVFEIKP